MADLVDYLLLEFSRVLWVGLQEVGMLVVGLGLLLLLVGVVVEALCLLLDRGATVRPLDSMMHPSWISVGHTRLLLDKSVALGEFFTQLIF